MIGCAPDLVLIERLKAPAKRLPHFNATDGNNVWPPCREVLQHVGCCWLKFENDQIFHATIVDVE